MSVDPLLEKRKAAGALVGKVVIWAHQGPEDKPMRVLSATYDGMVTVSGFTGHFAPHLFIVVAG